METISSRLNGETIDMFTKILGGNRSEIVRELVEAGKKSKAIELYKKRKVSLGLGAKLAGVPLSEFIDLLKEHNEYLNIEQEDVAQALKTARKTFK